MTKEPDELAKLKAENTKLRNRLIGIREHASARTHHAWDAHSEYMWMAIYALEGK